MVNPISGSGQSSISTVKGNCNPCTGCGDCGNPKITTLAQILKNATKPNGMKKPEELFKQMSLEAGGDGTKINKEQLQTLETKLSKEGKDTKILKDLIDNFDTIANGKDSITSDDIKTAMQNGVLKPPHKPDAKPPSSDDIQDPSTITKDQLESPIDLRV